MKRVIFFIATGIVLSGIIFLGCSEKKEAEAEKGRIEKFTDKKAEEIVDYVRTPVNKAREVSEMEEKRVRDMEKAMEDN
jgi:hypothetical protein